MLVHLLQHFAVDHFVVVVAFLPVGRSSSSPSLVGTYLLLVARGLEYIYPQVVQQTHAVVVVVAVAVVVVVVAAVAVVVVVVAVVVVAAAAVADDDIAFGDGIAVQPMAVLLLA